MGREKGSGIVKEVRAGGIRWWEDPESWAGPMSTSPSSLASAGGWREDQGIGCLTLSYHSQPNSLHTTPSKLSNIFYSLPLCCSFLSQFCSPFEADGCPCLNSLAIACMLVCEQRLNIPWSPPLVHPIRPTCTTPPPPPRFPERQGPRFFEFLSSVIRTGSCTPPAPHLLYHTHS